jgi:exodeoxyribonuclease III
MMPRMRIITLNACGLRSAARKGMFGWLAAQRADFICLQETRCQEHQLADHDVRIPGYRSYFYDAERPGYAGVAIYARREPDDVIRGFGVAEFDREGRYLEVRSGGVAVVSLYLPSGSAGPHRQAAKYRFLRALTPHLERLRRQRRAYLLCGDWNIAHRPIDLRNWRANQKHSGFLPRERAFLDHVFGMGAYVDAFREVNAAPEQYTWWSNRGRAWAKNVGWRIDYQVVSLALAGCARAASIYKEQRFSDHAPLTMDYQL